MHIANLKYTTIADLNDFHDYTNFIFLEHQKSIMNGELEQAFFQFSYLVKLIKQHLNDEEKYLIPPYQKLINPEPAGGAVRFYTREHRQILIIINKYLDKLQEWVKRPPQKIELVKQFDSYYKFKELLDHHDARERVFLYRLLDQKLDVNEKKEILTAIKQNMDEIIAKQ
jgi:hypothetical protein